MIVAIDLETTGLHVQHDAILEVAAVITDDALREVARYERVVYHPLARALAGLDPHEVAEAHAAIGIDPVVIEMHRKNGLWVASAASNLGIRQVDVELAALLRDRAIAREDGRVVKPQLLGSSVHFDRAFMARWMPETYGCLHYRQIDVTTINEMARRFWPAAHAARPTGGNHRAMPDIEASLETARYYANALQPSASDNVRIAQWLYSQPAMSTDDTITAILRGDWRAA